MGSSRNRYTGLDPRVVRLIQRKASRLVKRREFESYETDDLEQELALHFLRRFPRFDPARSQLHTFASVIIERKAASLIDARHAAMRDCRCNSGSLNEPVKGEEDGGFERGDLVDADGCRLRLGLAHRPEAEQRDLSIDVLRAVALLSPDLRELCTPLLAERVAEVSRATGIPRGTIYARLAKVKALFEERGLREYI